MHSQRQAKTVDKETKIRRSSTPHKTNSTQAPVNHPATILQQAVASSSSMTPGQVLQLQRAIGNRAVGQLIQRQVLEKEKELPQGTFSGSVQRKTVEEDEKTLQGKFVDQNNQANLTGMPDDVKAKMEGAFNTSFSDVRLYPNSRDANEVGALAYTQGTDIHFAPGHYNPDSSTGKKLLAHELAHVMQQRAGKVKATGSINGSPLNNNPTLEKEADLMGNKAVQLYAQVEKTRKNTLPAGRQESRDVANAHEITNNDRKEAGRYFERVRKLSSGVCQHYTNVKYNADDPTMGRQKLWGEIKHRRGGIGVHPDSKDWVLNNSRITGRPGGSACHHSMGYMEIKNRIVDNINNNANNLGDAVDEIVDTHANVDAGNGNCAPIPGPSDFTMQLLQGGNIVVERDLIEQAFQHYIRSIADYSDNLYYSPNERTATGAVGGGLRNEPGVDPAPLPAGWIINGAITLVNERARVRAARVHLNNCL